MAPTPVVLLIVGCLVLAGCETTKQKSARIAAGAQAAVTETGVDIGTTSRDVEVRGTAVVQDDNGTAVVVTVRNRSTAAQPAMPVLIDVRGEAGGSVFRNDAAGLDRSLTTIPALGPGKELSWVNDQVTASGRAASVSATVGTAPTSAKGRPVLLPITGTRLQGDPTSGIEATGTVTNTTTVDQRDVVLYAVGLRGRRVIAAGRAIVPRIAAGRRAVFHAFFIGDPEGTELRVTAPVVAP